MLERITNTDPLWEQPPFLEEEILFFLMYKLRGAQDGLFLTDRKNILLAQTSPDMQAWVWTSPQIDAAAVFALREACAAYNIAKATVRPTIGQQLYHPVQSHGRMYGNMCPSLRPPEGIAGACSRHASEEDTQIARMFAGFYAETGHAEGAEPAETYLPVAQASRENPNFAVWRDDAGDIVAMSRISFRSARLGCINAVFTDPSARGRGYAGALVATLAARIIDEGRTPILYTNADYPASNRAYQKIGFVPVGELVTVGRG